jgi:hypothetical protein
MKKDPIFFAWTRSFWSAVMTALLVIQSTGEPLVRALVTIAAPLTGWDIDHATAMGLSLLPILTLIFTLQQRSGAARPYTLDPRALR